MMTFIWVSLILILLSMLGLMYRVFKGPSIPDRLIALDGIGILIISATYVPDLAETLESR